MVGVPLEPLLLHALQKLKSNRVARSRTDDGINTAARAKRSIVGRRNVVISRSLLNPHVDLLRQEGRETVKATTHLAAKNLIAVSGAVSVRRDDVFLGF